MRPRSRLGCSATWAGAFPGGLDSREDATSPLSLRARDRSAHGRRLKTAPRPLPLNVRDADRRGLHRRRRCRRLDRRRGRRNRRSGRHRRSNRGRRRRHQAVVGHRRIDRARLDRRQEEERVEVPVALGCPPDTEVDVRHRQLGLAARPDGPDDLSLRDTLSAPDRVRPEMHERHRVAVRCRDRDRPSSPRNGARERDRSGGRRYDRCAGRRSDVDAPVLSPGVRIRPERKRHQHRPGDRPTPAQRRTRSNQDCDGYCADDPHLRSRPPLSDMPTAAS